MFTVSFNIVESINRLKTQEIVYIYPSLVSSHGNIRTTSRLCVFPERKDTRLLPVRKNWVVTGYITSCEGYSQFQRFEGAWNLRQGSIAFERWMASGHLLLREEVYGCAECGKGVSQLNIPVTGIDLLARKTINTFFILRKRWR